ncbi:MAG: Uma2 family endonuclease [Blastocatellia bacterium]
MIAQWTDVVVAETEGAAVNQSAPPLVRLFSLEEFARIAESMPDDRLELIHGEIVMAPPPDFTHIKQNMNVEYLLARHLPGIEKLGCRVMGSGAWYAVPRELKALWTQAGAQGPDHVCPDASVCYADYLDTARRPPALLVVEILSVSSRREIDRDLISKPDIYAGLEIPSYWVVDRREHIVWAHTAPENGQYTRRTQHKGQQVLPAPGLEFLSITPAQIFED